MNRYLRQVDLFLAKDHRGIARKARRAGAVIGSNDVVIGEGLIRMNRQGVLVEVNDDAIFIARAADLEDVRGTIATYPITGFNVASNEDAVAILDGDAAPRRL